MSSLLLLCFVIYDYILCNLSQILLTSSKKYDNVSSQPIAVDTKQGGA